MNLAHILNTGYWRPKLLENKDDFSVCARTQRANVHSQYLHCSWTDFAQILNAGYWRPKLFKNDDNITEKM